MVDFDFQDDFEAVDLGINEGPVEDGQVVASNKPAIKRTIEDGPFHMKEVEIIIPFNGEQARVIKAIEAIFTTISTNRYLITLVDDGSANRYFMPIVNRYKKRFAGVRCFRLEKSKGFGAAINHALKNPWVFTDNPRKQIPYVCILQSDARPEAGHWLSTLGNSLEYLKNDGIKMISPTTNNPMSSLNILEGEKGKITDDKIVPEDCFLPLYCALCHRELFNRVGLFKEFPYAGCEAEEFADRLKQHGFRQAVSGGSWVHHDGGATLARFKNNQKVLKILRNAEEQFLSMKKARGLAIHTNEVG